MLVIEFNQDSCEAKKQHPFKATRSVVLVQQFIFVLVLVQAWILF